MIRLITPERVEAIDIFGGLPECQYECLPALRPEAESLGSALLLEEKCHLGPMCHPALGFVLFLESEPEFLIESDSGSASSYGLEYFAHHEGESHAFHPPRVCRCAFLEEVTSLNIFDITNLSNLGHIFHIPYLL